MIHEAVLLKGIDVIPMKRCPVPSRPIAPIRRNPAWPLAFVFLIAGIGALPQSAESADWITHGGDASNSRYASFGQINRENFSDLEIAWRWQSIETRITEINRRVRPGQFKPTPLVVAGLMFLPTSIGQIVALDPATGETAWEFDTRSYEAGRPANLGFQHRGVSYWTDGSEKRILMATGDRKLWSLDAETGKPDPNFGNGGAVDLSASLGKRANPRVVTHSSPVAVCNDTIVVGSIIFDGPTMKEMPPGHVRAFDVRTGQLKWIFHTIPQEGEFGVETWENESWKYSGNTNVWTTMSVDEELNYVYLPISTPTNDMYGGHRLGDNLFGESIVCVDAETGERVWHFQTIHHGLWDYDLPAAPNLADVTIDGRPRKILAQVSKQAFLYVLDRVTGEPIWPIEERPVPPSTVPGERASPTQPFPTKPAAYDRQGFTEEDLINFTPELHTEALKLIEGFPRGPLYTPPSLEGTYGLPHNGGGSNWQGAALDPEMGILYIPSITSTASFTVIQPDPNRSNFKFATGWLAKGRAPQSVQGLPLARPPYSRVTAIDLNTGEHVWMTPHGEGPVDHPAIAHLDLGPLGVVPARATGKGPLVTQSLLFVTQGEAELGTEADQPPKITVFDKMTGERLGLIPLPANPHGNPMTYMHEGKQYIAVAVGGGGLTGRQTEALAELVVLGLP